MCCAQNGRLARLIKVGPHKGWGGSCGSIEREQGASVQRGGAGEESGGGWVDGGGWGGTAWRRGKVRVYGAAVQVGTALEEQAERQASCAKNSKCQGTRRGGPPAAAAVAGAACEAGRASDRAARHRRASTLGVRQGGEEAHLESPGWGVGGQPSELGPGAVEGGGAKRGGGNSGALPHSKGRRRGKSCGRSVSKRGHTLTG